jgi:hypothetical protein
LKGSYGKSLQDSSGLYSARRCAAAGALPEHEMLLLQLQFADLLSWFGT